MMEMIQTVLDYNMFGFGDKCYIQKEDIAIGSRLGKNFACAYMPKWDDALLQFRASLYFYKMFMDDEKGLAYGLRLRNRRICEKESDYLRHRKELKLQLQRRGYSGKLIETQLRKVDKLDRDELLGMKRQDKNAKRVPLLVTFSNLPPDMQSVVRKHMDVLYRSGKMREVFKEPPIVAFRQDRNMCDTLVHSKTNKAVKSSSQT